MEEVKKLHTEYQLDQRQFELITQDIIEQNTTGIHAEAQPKVVILGGQPGSGKGELTHFAVEFLKGNTVICNADDYRDHHPKSDEIKSLHEEHYPEVTVVYSHQWNRLLMEYCISEKLNFVLETTFSSGEGMNQTIAMLKDAGYQVYLKIIAVNKLLSFMSTRLRYENMKADFGFGRLVDPAAHDDKYYKVEQTLRIVQEKKAYDGLFIYARAGRQMVKGKRNGMVLMAENSNDPMEVYLSERDRKWSDNDRSYFMLDLLGLIRMMVDRKASNKQLKEVMAISDTEFLTPTNSSN